MDNFFLLISSAGSRPFSPSLMSCLEWLSWWLLPCSFSSCSWQLELVYSTIGAYKYCNFVNWRRNRLEFSGAVYMNWANSTGVRLFCTTSKLNANPTHIDKYIYILSQRMNYGTTSVFNIYIIVEMPNWKLLGNTIRRHKEGNVGSGGISLTIIHSVCL